eukprot:TRINITY_DN972_c0_g1_i1.p1 TRINITY_DN972_c0_g1~~TRINITY_DN972_c0_g1_i1.p1  ORF type:complete len:1297 (-),score=162.09 TRINITY_DN972_c0_g1_i1:445-4335(-)
MADGKASCFCIVHPESSLGVAKFGFGPTSVDIELPEEEACEDESFSINRGPVVGSSSATGSSFRSFSFDRVFDPGARQDTVFQEVARSAVVQSLGSFRNSLFLALGGTGGGKTFVSTGGAKSFADRGLIPRSVTALFETLAARPDRASFEVSISFFEIYRDSVIDLLCGKRRRVLVEDSPDGPRLVGLLKQVAKTESEAYHLLFQGDSNRHFERLPENPETSRGHVFYQMHVTHGSGQETVLAFADLAAPVSTKNHATATIVQSLEALRALSRAMCAGLPTDFNSSLLTKVLMPWMNPPHGQPLPSMAIIHPLKYIVGREREVYDFLQLVRILHQAMKTLRSIEPTAAGPLPSASQAAGPMSSAASLCEQEENLAGPATVSGNLDLGEQPLVLEPSLQGPALSAGATSASCLARPLTLVQDFRSPAEFSLSPTSFEGGSCSAGSPLRWSPESAVVSADGEKAPSMHPTVSAPTIPWNENTSLPQVTEATAEPYCISIERDVLPEWERELPAETYQQPTQAQYTSELEIELAPAKKTTPLHQNSLTQDPYNSSNSELSFPSAQSEHPRPTPLAAQGYRCTSEEVLSQLSKPAHFHASVQTELTPMQTAAAPSLQEPVSKQPAGICMARLAGSSTVPTPARSQRLPGSTAIKEPNLHSKDTGSKLQDCEFDETFGRITSLRRSVNTCLPSQSFTPPLPNHPAHERVVASAQLTKFIDGPVDCSVQETDHALERSTTLRPSSQTREALQQQSEQEYLPLNAIHPQHIQAQPERSHEYLPLNAIHLQHVQTQPERSHQLQPGPAPWPSVASQPQFGAINHTPPNQLPQEDGHHPIALDSSRIFVSQHCSSASEVHQISPLQAAEAAEVEHAPRQLSPDTTVQHTLPSYTPLQFEPLACHTTAQAGPPQHVQLTVPEPSYMPLQPERIQSVPLTSCSNQTHPHHCTRQSLNAQPTFTGRQPQGAMGGSVFSKHTPRSSSAPGTARQSVAARHSVTNAEELQIHSARSGHPVPVFPQRGRRSSLGSCGSSWQPQVLEATGSSPLRGRELSPMREQPCLQQMCAASSPWQPAAQVSQSPQRLLEASPAAARSGSCMRSCCGSSSPMSTSPVSARNSVYPLPMHACNTRINAYARDSSPRFGPVSHMPQVTQCGAMADVTLRTTAHESSRGHGMLRHTHAIVASARDASRSVSPMRAVHIQSIQPQVSTHEQRFATAVAASQITQGRTRSVSPQPTLLSAGQIVPGISTAGAFTVHRREMVVQSNTGSLHVQSAPNHLVPSQAASQMLPMQVAGRSQLLRRPGG